MKVPLIGATIDRIILDYAITLAFDENRELRIEVPFSIKASNSSVAEVASPGELGAQQVRIDSLLRQVVSIATADAESGQLDLEFASGDTLSVNSDQSYEAWTFTSADGTTLVASPGGGVGTWGMQSTSVDPISLGSGPEVQRDESQSGGDFISVREAFLAMSDYIWEFAKRAGGDLLTLIGDTGLEADGQPTDPAAWSDWVNSVAKITRGEDPR